jgi:hypothetical protein
MKKNNLFIKSLNIEKSLKYKKILLKATINSLIIKQKKMIYRELLHNKMIEKYLEFHLCNLYKMIRM